VFPAASLNVAVITASGATCRVTPFAILSAVSVTVVCVPSTVYVKVSPTSEPSTAIVAVRVPSSPSSAAL